MKILLTFYINFYFKKGKWLYIFMTNFTHGLN